MIKHKIIKHSDPISPSDLDELVRHTGPIVSIYMPTHRGGREVQDGPLQLRPLVEQAQKELEANYPDVAADDILSPVTALLDSSRFWQHLCDGLVIFAGNGFARSFRLDTSFKPRVVVEDTAHLVPLLPTVAENLDFILLALSLNKVRLYEADRFAITELPLGDIPGSTEELEGFYSREPQFQHQGVPGRVGAAHGHGPREYNTRDGFLQTIGKRMQARFAAAKEPLVIAAVSEYYTPLTSEMPGVTVLGKPVAGNPDQLNVLQLHEAAWPVVAAETTNRHQVNRDRFGSAIGAGNASTDLDEIKESAEIARIDTLLLTDQVVQADTTDMDQAIAATLRFGGHVDIVPDLPDGNAAGAIYRF